jgi:hypothetical protein
MVGHDASEGSIPEKCLLPTRSDIMSFSWQARPTLRYHGDSELTMQVRLQSKTGPLIPSDDDLLRSLREQTKALQSQWRDRLAHDPAGFAQLEVEIHDHFRRLADQMTASLLAQATMTHDQAEPGKKGVPTPPAAADAPPNRAP